jgi:hypothetical protein
MLEEPMDAFAVALHFWVGFLEEEPATDDAQ